MLKKLLVVLISLHVTSSLVWNTSFHSVGTRQFYEDKKRWYKFGDNQTLIAFQLDQGFSRIYKNYIRNQFKKLTSVTCLTTHEYAFDEVCDDTVSCIRILKQAEPSPCTTDGNIWMKEIHLSKHCFDDHWVLHEILHALGFGHEHQRRDRDCYVEITGPGLTDPQYTKDASVDISFPYDVHSIMHYRRGDRIKPAKFRWDQDEKFGHLDELTEMDTIALNYMYCGGRHYCDINPVRCQYFRCWIECNPCSDEQKNQCRDCTGNTY